MKENKKKEESAIETVIKWNYHPSEIENRVDSKPFTKKEKELIEKMKF